MNVDFWTAFSKRRNSTKQPPTAGSPFTVTLKETTSVERPTFVINTNNFNVSYAKAFNNYYFVDDVKSIRNDIIEVSCKKDVLATHKTDIVGSSQFVERADISGIVPRVPDSFNPPTDDIEIKSTDIINLGWAGNPTLILGTVSSGGVSYYAMDDARLRLIMGNLFGSNFVQQFTNQFYGLRECLISLKKVPYTPAGTTDTVVIGEYDTQDSATRVSQSIIHDDATVTVNRPSDDYEPGTSYLDFSPYSVACVYLPYVGVVPLDMEILGDTRSLTVDYWLDQITADIAYKLSTNGKIIGTYSGNCGANLPIASQNYNAAGVAGGLLSAIGGIIADNPALTASGLLGAYKETAIHSQISGVLSSFIGNSVGTMVTAFVITKVPVSWNLELNRSRCGLPIQKTMSLSGLSGYCQCRNASVSISGFDSDRSEIESFMNSGFYIE